MSFWELPERIPHTARKSRFLAALGMAAVGRSSEDLVGGLWRSDAQGDLVGDGDAVALEGNHLFRMVGEDANVPETEVDQDLRADAAFVLHHALAGGLAIELAALVKMDLRERSRLFGGIHGEAAAGVVQV